MKKFQIKDVSKLLGISTYTLRYYEKIGLLNFVKRNSNGDREFESRDLITINTVICLKQTGMPLKDIKNYLQLIAGGLATAEERKEMFLKQKQKVISEIADLQKALQVIDRKVSYYDEAVNSQSLDVCQEERQEWLQNILAGKEKAKKISTTLQTIEQLTQANAEVIAQDWHYDGEYDFYDMENDLEDYDEIVTPELRGDRYFQVLDDQGQLTAFFCLEPTTEPGRIELGLGMAPELTGQGRGSQLLQVIDGYVRQQGQYSKITLAVASFNQRAFKVYQKAGFVVTGRKQMPSNGGSYEFILMAKELMQR
ncbi:GNAT family N-acetyltransferase [Lactobacillus xylocopicola]|uniref:Uncharacterized protein n=1 Tax=Lactobacillus xylocopicola TaxID=2976676 RepID=A0ABN6SLF1_9LACO|nr:GNAT family N-acetyltransferase [Lactobacillus xylocopicola]BDR61200.1 hypothetical protein KIM322_14610 [Lactobacillus xylocopicola]